MIKEIKIKPNKYYRYNPNLNNFLYPISTVLKLGDIVKVVDGFNYKKTGDINACHIERNGTYIGIISKYSLEDIKIKEN